MQRVLPTSAPREVLDSLRVAYSSPGPGSPYARTLARHPGDPVYSRPVSDPRPRPESEEQEFSAALDRLAVALRRRASH